MRRTRWLIVLSIVWLVGWAVKDTVFLALLRQQAKKIPDAQITVGNAHLGLFPGVVELDDIDVVRPAEKGRSGVAAKPLPLAHIEHTKTSWKYRHLLRGIVTASAKASGVDVVVWRVPKKSTGDGQKKSSGDAEVVPAPPEADTIMAVWPQISRFIVPISVDEIDADRVRVWLRDESVTPPLRFPVEGIAMHAENLTNRKALSDGRYAAVNVQAAPAKGKLNVAMQVDPMARLPTFSMHASLKDLEVPNVNEVLLAYANFDAESGTLNAEIDVACEQGKFRGTLAPRLEKFAAKKRADEDENNTLKNRAFRFLINAATFLVKDSKDEKIATNVPLAGQFTDPSIGVGQAVLSLLGNAWWQSLAPAEGLPKGALPELRGSMGRQGQAVNPPSPPKKGAKKRKK